MKMLAPIPLAAIVLCLACRGERGLVLDEGDPVAGRLVFAAMQCYTCHQVAGEKFPAPTANPSVPVALGSQLAKKPRHKLADSIIYPSHEIAKKLKTVKFYNYDYIPREVTRVVEEDYENVTIDGALSRMDDYGDVITVQQLADLVAYLQSLPESES